ncbi:MAG: nucleoside deaminase [Deltaproteobacteria bacterium]|nr:nucleoside deaminase [Deltaproteobacteria bacterium]
MSKLAPLPTTLGPHSLSPAIQTLARDFVQAHPRATPAAQAELVVTLSRASMREGGGPFGAAVFALDGALVSVGVNCVVPWKSYEFHAEVVALALAKTVTEALLLPSEWHLVSSSAPCCMCFGRLFWSGVRALTVCARREDVESLTGFDEGPIPANWQQELRDRGFVVYQDLARDDAREVLSDYRGPVYQRPSA